MYAYDYLFKRFNMKAISFLIIFLFITSTHLNSLIIETDDISSIMTEADSQTLVLFNITNTIYTSSTTMGDSLWKNYFAKKVHDLLSDQKTADDVVNHVKNKIVTSVPKKLVDEKIAGMITCLQENQIPVLGLTLKHLSRPYAENFGEITSKHLVSLGIDFEKTNAYLQVDLDRYNEPQQQYAYGLIFTSGSPPGNAVSHFLKRTSLTKVIIIDDRQRNLEDAEQIILQNDIAFTGFRYTKCDTRKERFDPTLGIIEFLKFLSTGEVISDDEAASIKELTPFIHYETLLEEAILSLPKDKA